MKLPEARKQLVKRYVERQLRFAESDRSKSEVLQRYLSSMTHSFDPHSSYMSPQTREDFDISHAAETAGDRGGAQQRGRIPPIVRQDRSRRSRTTRTVRLQLGDKIIGVGQARRATSPTLSR